MADEEPSYETHHDESAAAKKRKKKKKKKSSSLADEPSYETQHEESIPAEKHKKKKSSSMADEPSYDSPQEEEEEESIPADETKKKSKHKKLKVKMEAIPECPDRTPPVVGYFPSGYKPNNHAAGNTFDLYRHVRHPNRLEAVVRPKNSNVEFVGTSYSGEAASPQVCTYALGVFDKEAKTLKFVPIAANKIFRFEPRVMRDKEPAHSEPSECLTELSATGKVEKRIQDLTSIYGTKKDKTRDRKFQTLNDLKNYDLGEAEEFLKNQDQESEPEVEMRQSSKGEAIRNIPPFNPSADASEKVYDLDKIIPSGERPYLLDILDDYRDKGANYPSFVANRVKKLNTTKDDEREKLACMLSYITHLHAIWDRYRKNKPKEEKKHLKIPRIMRQRLISLFVDPESKMLSSEKNELLIGYILVLTLFVDNFKSDPSDIAKDLMMTSQALRPYYLQLGCKFVSEAGRKGFATLPVPLEFTDMRRRGIKRNNIM